MLIAKLTIYIENSGIQYNSPAELKTERRRGDVLEDGKVVRGLGTHFASKEAEERYNKNVAEANEIRAKFNRRFGRGPLDSTYIIAAEGEAKTFGQNTTTNPDLCVVVDELNLTGGLSERTMREWETRLKEGLKRVPLGRGKEIDDEGILALEQLAQCPVFTVDTKDAILRMVNEVKIGKMNRVDLKRGIALLKVNMDTQTLMAPRSRPTPTVAS